MLVVVGSSSSSDYVLTVLTVTCTALSERKLRWMSLRLSESRRATASSGLSLVRVVEKTQKEEWGGGQTQEQAEEWGGGQATQEQL